MGSYILSNGTLGMTRICIKVYKGVLTIAPQPKNLGGNNMGSIAERWRAAVEAHLSRNAGAYERARACRGMQPPSAAVECAAEIMKTTRKKIG